MAAHRFLLALNGKLPTPQQHEAVVTLQHAAVDSQLDEEETAEADHDEDAADKPHEKERAKQRARLAAVLGALGPRQTLPVRGVPGVELGVVDASERPVLAELDIGADEQRQQADHGEPEIADELEGDHGEQNGERCRDQRESVLGSQNLKDLAEHAALARISPSDLTPDAKGARWRSNLYCAARSATRVVPH